MIRGQNLPAITQIADSDVLIVDSASGGTRKITYAQLCQAVKQTLGIREVIDSVNITEDGYLMGGKTIADEFAKLNNDMDTTQIALSDFCNYQGEAIVDANIYQNGKIICIYVKLSGSQVQNNALLFTVKSKFKPATGYAILPVRGNAGPYQDKGSLWISGASGVAQVYGSYSSDYEIYVYGVYVIA